MALVTTTLSATDAAGSAGINFIRTPRVVPRTPAVEIKLPEAPTQQNPNPLPFIAMLAPAFMGLMIVFGDPQPLLAHVRMHEPNDDGWYVG